MVKPSTTTNAPSQKYDHNELLKEMTNMIHVDEICFKVKPAAPDKTLKIRIN